MRAISRGPAIRNGTSRKTPQLVQVLQANDLYRTLFSSGHWPHSTPVRPCLHCSFDSFNDTCIPLLAVAQYTFGQLVERRTLVSEVVPSVMYV